VSSAMYPNVWSSIDAVFDGVDAGHFTIPERLETARAGLRTLQENLRAVSAPQPGPTALREAHASQLVAIANEGAGSDGALDGSALRTAVKSAETRKEDRRLLVQAIGKVDLSGVIIGVADELVTEHLRPAFQEIAGAVSGLLPDLEGPLDPVGLASAPEASRAAYLAVLPLLARHQAVRRAQKSLRTGYFNVFSRRPPRGQEAEDVHDYFLDTRCWPALRSPGVYIVSPAGTIDAGPADPLARLLWLATPRGPRMAANTGRAGRRLAGPPGRDGGSRPPPAPDPVRGRRRGDRLVTISAGVERRPCRSLLPVARKQAGGSSSRRRISGR
jgi:hypothetical protein